MPRWSVTVRNELDDSLVRRLRFDGERVSVGSDESTDIQLSGAEIPPKAFSLVYWSGKYEIEVERDVAGATLGGRPLDPGQIYPLDREDRIGLGAFEFIVRCGGGSDDEAADFEDPHAGTIVQPTGRRGATGRRVRSDEHVSDKDPRLKVWAKDGTEDFAEKDRTVTVESGGTLTIGRAEDCDLVLPDPAVSRKHAEVKRSGYVFRIRNVSEKNTLVVRNEKLGTDDDWHDLDDRDEIRVGPYRLRYYASSEFLSIGADPEVIEQMRKEEVQRKSARIKSFESLPWWKRAWYRMSPGKEAWIDPGQPGRPAWIPWVVLGGAALLIALIAWLLVR